ncbi:hypothetical protein [Methylobacterium oxalidis]|uniref:Uncharacterized protein n=1 Tax=Methylobacterium oxalidis TaxID=944322 RepID=A0A512IYE9_9HYPH|nr:hypothetical protein [Methylobacterium oxalidis]GEP02639.1 hypothetical protein MOX02_06770 [Methylobacterium oxalidis]GJE30030.1 hypothetical protein LDDCCGHA_0193 [Methylobacterium oxalidis]GLS61848.1 hypothetical protein GCM10007888_02290 [Methylobacterium oxalidis]
MLLVALIALTTLTPRIETGLEAARARIAWTERTAPIAAALPAPAEVPAMPRFVPEARAVTNWRREAGAALRPASLALVARYAAIDPPFVARCVKLNNYWCIKQARWSGEIGGDAEGHTGFATAADGADAAALLLRRYYRDYGRRTALAVVRRWAPAACGLPAAGTARAPAAGAAPAVSTALAPHGIGRTLRARFLARNARGGAPRRALAARPARNPAAAARPELRIQPWSPLARMGGHPGRRAARAPLPPLRPVADIASGVTATPRAGAARLPPLRGADDPAALLARPSLSPDRLVAESAALPAIAAGLPLLDLRLPAPLCANDAVRIANYAGRIAASVGLKPADDLNLFDGTGRPLPNLAPVMLAMSGVELGTLRAGPDLVAAAIARLAEATARAAPTADAAR